MAALPASFFAPGTTLLSTAKGTRSAAQVCAVLYISQYTLLAGTGPSGAEDLLVSVLVLDSGATPQEVRVRMPTTTAAFRQMPRIGSPRSVTACFVTRILSHGMTG